MSIPEPFSREEREYYANFKSLVRDSLPGGKKIIGDLHTAYFDYFKREQIILSRRDKYRLFLLIMEEVLEEMNTELAQLQP